MKFSSVSFFKDWLRLLKSKILAFCMLVGNVDAFRGYRILIWVDAIRTQGCLTIINALLKKSKRINLEYSLHVRLFCDERKAIRGISSRTNVWLILVYVRFDDLSRLSCVMWFYSIYISSGYIAINLLKKEDILSCSKCT